METAKMINVTVNGTVRQYPYGTAYRTIAADFQAEYPHQILLVTGRASSGSFTRPLSGTAPSP